MSSDSFPQQPTVIEVIDGDSSSDDEESRKAEPEVIETPAESSEAEQFMPSTILHPPLATKISAATMNSAVSRSPATRLFVITWILKI